MSDELPEELMLKKMKKYLSTVARKPSESVEQREDPEKVVLSHASDDRAVELLEKTKLLYPEVYKALVVELYKLIKQGALKELDGLTVYSIIRQLGLNVKPELRLKFVKHGKEVDFKDYVS